MISCSYNGWTDLPEEEREAMDVFEAAHPIPAPAPVTRILFLPHVQRTRKAA